LEGKLIFSFISSIPFFREFTHAEKDVLVNMDGIFLKFQPSQLIIREGDQDESLFILLRGSVNITKMSQPHVVLASLKAGAMFGEITLISPRARTTNAVAATEVIVMQINKEMIEKFDPVLQKKFQNQMIQLLVQRLDQANARITQLLQSAET